MALEKAAAQHDAAGAPVDLERELLLREFEALLPAALRLYGYGDEDVRFLRGAMASEGDSAEQELRLTIRQWRVDLVANNLDCTPVMPQGVAERARLEFRRSVQGLATDESGAPITSKALEWRPEHDRDAAGESGGGLAPASTSAAPSRPARRGRAKP